MANSEIDIRNNPAESRYEAWLGDELAGFVTYELRDATIVFVHTEVDDANEGEGIGSALARGALDDVRRDGELEVVAQCPFVRKWIERHPAYQDLLA
jgi:predicted GNAT family acetyltransferase